jgi:hypothetical protein
MAIADFELISKDEEALSNDFTRVLKQIKSLASRTKHPAP